MHQSTSAQAARSARAASLASIPTSSGPPAPGNDRSPISSRFPNSTITNFFQVLAHDFEAYLSPSFLDLVLFLTWWRTSIYWKAHTCLNISLSIRDFGCNSFLHLVDYNMLEDVKRIADSARRRRVTVCGYSQWLPKPLKNLRGAAARRRTQLLFLAKGMSKREKNNTYYNSRWICYLMRLLWWLFKDSTLLLCNQDFVSTQFLDIWHLIPGKTQYLGLLNGGFIWLMLCCLIMGESFGWMICTRGFWIHVICWLTLICTFTVNCSVFDL